MNILQALKDERKWIDNAIAALEGSSVTPATPVERLGGRHWTAAQRNAHAKRMRANWKKRKAA